MSHTPHPNSKPKRLGRSAPQGTFAKAEQDSWQLRLRLALRLKNGMVLTARQCEALAEALGWRREPEPSPEAA